MVKKFLNIRELVEESAVKFENKLAFKLKHYTAGNDFEYEEITYKRFNQDIRALGKYLIDKGYCEKRVAIIGDNSYAWMVVYLATMCINSVIVPLDRGLLDYEVNEQLSRSEADAVFCTSKFYEMIDAQIPKFHTDTDEFKEIIKEGYALENDDVYNSIQIDNTKLSSLLFTSGTTSKSKAVMLSQINLTSNVHSLTLWVDIYDTDVNMAILPFHHTFGSTQMLFFLSCGVCNVFCEGLRVAKCLTEYNVSILVGVPRIIDSMYSVIQKKLEEKGKLGTVNRLIPLTSTAKRLNIDIRRKLYKGILDSLGGALRLIIVGAAAADPLTLKFFNDIGILTIQGYGLTETAPVLSAENKYNMRNNSIGKPLPNIEVKIDSPDENNIGEIIARGENVMLGYYNNKDASDAVLRNGYFYTGDMGYFDKDGFLYITGRKKNVIVLNNGKNIFPEEIEALLNQSSAIKECIVSNKRSGDKDSIFAKIVYNTTDYSLEEAADIIKNHIEEVNTKLVSYKQIKDYEITDKEMPKTTTLKIKR